MRYSDCDWDCVRTDSSPVQTVVEVAAKAGVSDERDVLHHLIHRTGLSKRLEQEGSNSWPTAIAVNDDYSILLHHRTIITEVVYPIP